MKNIMSKIYLEILDKRRQELFNFLSSFNREGYLAGETALALQVRHRKSFDFDIFIKNPVNNKLRLKIKKALGEIKIRIDTKDQIVFDTFDGISITFLWYYFPILNPLIKTDSISLASVADIASDKAYTIGRRAVWRDYVDLYFLIQKAIDLPTIIDSAKRKFGNNFNESRFLEQLVYYKDLEIVPLEFIDKKIKDDEIKSFLEKKVKNYIKDFLSS